MIYTVSYQAVFNILCEVEADSAEQAIAKAKDADTLDEKEEYSYVHPHTDFLVTEGGSHD